MRLLRHPGASWTLSLIATLTYFITVLLFRTSRVPFLDGVLLFLAYYVAFGLLFGWLPYVLYRKMRRTAARGVVIAGFHLLFIVLFLQALENFPTGPFLSGHAP
ncbi:hypothetical protein [Cohnella sp. REN36]|uniref:hypothetical protein n=1 Tax=Cohnella sp. REN36 TaxID=2887347 RepID=UPI001D143022|nr:hypothetical protein [Cohnella sp. REN36]MCC3373408.1 hypothetical protein [Cohnella sp. REN36]